MQDLQGPKIRLGKLPDAGVVLTENTEVVFDTAITDYKDAALPIAFPTLEKHVAVNDRILIDDGHMEVKIQAVQGTQLITVVIQGGSALSHKGLNFPDSTLGGIPALSEKDKNDVVFGVAQGVDSISLSFVKRPQDIVELRELVTTLENPLHKKDISLVAKIERPEAVSNLAEILQVADMVMVARGDLGLEMPQAELPITQKNIIRAARKAGKPVIVATQLLDSMQHDRRPTRAEVSDVANAVIDGADALLLTNETAVGEFPVEAISTMHDIILETEASTYDDAVTAGTL
jgi:pyruvate kinase